MLSGLNTPFASASADPGRKERRRKEGEDAQAGIPAEGFKRNETRGDQDTCFFVLSCIIKEAGTMNPKQRPGKENSGGEQA